MTPDEFDEWLTYHATLYPGIKRWLAKTENDGVEAAWEQLLDKTPFSAAKMASYELFEQDDQPRGFGEHPRIVKRLAWAHQPQRHGPKYVDGQETFRCARCCDSGLVSVLSPDSLKAVWNDTRTEGLRWCAVACDCDSGEQYATAPKGVRALPRWTKDLPLLSWEKVCEHAEQRFGEGWGTKLFDAAGELLAEYDEQRGQGESLDDVQFSAPYPGEF